MSDKDLLYQILNRELSNILGNFGVSFRLLAPTITNYLINLAEPYLAAFTNNDTGKVNSKMAGAFMKQEVNEKIDAFIKNFEAEQNKEND